MSDPVTYTTVERDIDIFSRLTEAQFERCHALTHRIPGRFKGWPDRFMFEARDDADLLALQNYVIEQGLPHRITTTREWKP